MVTRNYSDDVSDDFKSDALHHKRWIGKPAHPRRVDFFARRRDDAASEEMTMMGRLRRNHGPAFKA